MSAHDYGFVGDGPVPARKERHDIPHFFAHSNNVHFNAPLSWERKALGRHFLVNLFLHIHKILFERIEQALGQLTADAKGTNAEILDLRAGSCWLDVGSLLVVVDRILHDEDCSGPPVLGV